VRELQLLAPTLTQDAAPNKVIASANITIPTSFGAGGFNDYPGLFLWGISSDVVQRTLLQQRVPT